MRFAQGLINNKGKQEANVNRDDRQKPIRLFDIYNRSEQPVYWLVAADVHPEFHDFWQAQIQNNPCHWCRLFDGSDFEVYSGASPLLIRIEDGGPGETLFHWVLDALREAADTEDPSASTNVSTDDSNNVSNSAFESPFENIGQIWQSPDDLHRLKQQLQPWLTCHYPFNETSLFEFYRNPVMRRWLSVLSPEDKITLIGTATLYLPGLPDSEADTYFWYTGQSPQITPATSGSLAVQKQRQQQLTEQGGHSLSKAHYSQIFYEDRIERIVMQIYQQRVQQQGELFDPAWVQLRFEQSLELGHRLYPQEDDITIETFALYRFLISSEFYQHPEFIRLTREYSLRDSIGLFSNSEEYRAELQQHYHQKEWLPSGN